MLHAIGHAIIHANGHAIVHANSHAEKNKNKVVAILGVLKFTKPRLFSSCEITVRTGKQSHSGPEKILDSGPRPRFRTAGPEIKSGKRALIVKNESSCELSVRTTATGRLLIATQCYKFILCQHTCIARVGNYCSYLARLGAKHAPVGLLFLALPRHT